MNRTDNDPRPDWAALGWITDRLPTCQDADSDGDVWLPREVGESAGGGTYVNYLAVVAVGQPWCSSNVADRANQSAPTDPDRIAALEHRVAQNVRAQSVLAAALVKRLEALEGLAPDGAVPEGGAPINGVERPLSQRVPELEATMRQLLHGSRVHLGLEPR